MVIMNLFPMISEFLYVHQPKFYVLIYEIDKRHPNQPQRVIPPPDQRRSSGPITTNLYKRRFSKQSSSIMSMRIVFKFIIIVLGRFPSLKGKIDSDNKYSHIRFRSKMLNSPFDSSKLVQLSMLNL